MNSTIPLRALLVGLLLTLTGCTAPTEDGADDGDAMGDSMGDSMKDDGDAMDDGHDHGDAMDHDHDHGDGVYHVGSHRGYTIAWEETVDAATVGEEVRITWTVTGPDSFPHTGLHWGMMSLADGTDVHDYPNVSGAVNGELFPPHTHAAVVVFDAPGTYYFRGHAQLDDVDNLQTEEWVVEVSDA